MAVLRLAELSSLRLPGRAARFLAVLAGLIGLVVVATVSMLWPNAEDRSNLEIPFEPTGPVAQPFTRFGLGGWLVRQADGEVRAFSTAEPRTGCRIDFIGTGHPFFAGSEEEYYGEPGFFLDRCWGSKWALDGTRTFGPSWRGMDEFGVRQVAAGRVSLDLTRVRLGTCVPSVRYDCSSPDAPRYVRPRVALSDMFW
ncbi:MAG: hypothetical protein AB7I38_05655 [Dehalococcoidia bacterium]